MSKTVMKIRAYTIWNCEAELKWLDSMARQGYLLQKVIPFIYFFERTEPKEVNYCHGFARVRKDDRKSYFDLYRDSGWKHVTTYANWQHFFYSEKDELTLQEIETAYSEQKKLLNLKHIAVFNLIFLLLNIWFLINIIRHPDGPFPAILPLFLVILHIGCFFLFSYGRKRQLENINKINGQEIS